MGRPPMSDAAKPKHVLSFRATDAQRKFLEDKYGKPSKGLLELVKAEMKKEQDK